LITVAHCRHGSSNRQGAGGAAGLEIERQEGAEISCASKGTQESRETSRAVVRRWGIGKAIALGRATRAKPRESWVCAKPKAKTGEFNAITWMPTGPFRENRNGHELNPNERSAKLRHDGYSNDDHATTDALMTNKPLDFQERGSVLALGDLQVQGGAFAVDYHRG
jgi:hypothetical protein